jgi:glycopeptide antibiotics resistance protein
MAKQTRLLNLTITFLSLILILFITLFPFNFLFEETFSGLDKFILGWGISTPLDILLNVLLFLPLGFGLTSYLMQKKSAAGLSVFGVILLVSFGLSYSIEILQVFQPSRFPSLFDVFSNCVGGLLGYIVSRSYQIRSFKQ